MNPQTATAWATLALVAGEGALLWQDLSGGGLGSHGGAKRYLAVGLAGGAAIFVASVSPELGLLMAVLLIFATVFVTLSSAGGISHQPGGGLPPPGSIMGRP